MKHKFLKGIFFHNLYWVEIVIQGKTKEVKKKSASYVLE